MLKAGFPINTADYKNESPLEYALDKKQVSNQTFQRLLELSLNNGFDLMKQHTEVVRGQKKGSFWEQMIKRGRLTKELVWLVKEKLGDRLKVEDLAEASRLLHATQANNLA